MYGLYRIAYQLVERTYCGRKVPQIPCFSAKSSYIAQIVDNLIKLIGKSSVSEIACIEEALSRIVSEEKIPSEVFLILWSIAAKAHGKPRSVAMMILSMGASSDPSIVDSASRLRHLLVAGLGDYTEENRDWATAKSAAYALQRVSRVKCDPS